ncbi:MAG: aminopeptidase, partial [Desulfovibrio sp.]|nr:aminopeptidase [Desulfovibrio sp.]
MDLLYKPKSAWEFCEDKAEDLQSLVSRYLNFISQCKTERETIKNVEEDLRACGFGDDPGQD